MNPVGCFLELSGYEVNPLSAVFPLKWLNTTANYFWLLSREIEAELSKPPLGN